VFGSKKKKSPSSSTDSGSRLFSWMGNLAVFYVTLLALISIPFLVLALILFFQTVIYYHVWILVGIATVIAVALLFFIRRRKQIREQYEAEKKDVMEIIRSAAQEGHNVNISFMRGLISLDYRGSNNDGRLLEGSKLSQLKALPLSTSGNESEEIMLDNSKDLSETQTPGIASELEKLSGLLEKGLLTEAEYQELKTRLIDHKLSNLNLY
jgi:Ca2+/Na+ antiporter